MRTSSAALLLAATAAALAACGKREVPVAPHAKVLATVNGVPITEDDLAQRARKALAGGGPGHEAPKDAGAAAGLLQTVVREELVYQQGLQLGLDADPEYRRRVDDLEAQLRAFRRQEMGSLFRGWVHQQAAVTDAEAKAWFEKNAAFVQTRFHVLQIFLKGRRAELERDQQDLAKGTPFEEVAARRFAGMPPTPQPPWDLGELTWSQLPKEWRGAVERLEPGQSSGLIEGPNERGWLIKLVKKRVDPTITLATERARIGELLGQQKADELYASTLAAIKAKASVVYPQ